MRHTVSREQNRTVSAGEAVSMQVERWRAVSSCIKICQFGLLGRACVSYTSRRVVTLAIGRHRIGLSMQVVLAATCYVQVASSAARPANSADSLFRRASDLRTSRPEKSRAPASAHYLTFSPLSGSLQSGLLALTRTRPTDWRCAAAGARPRRRDRATRSRRSCRPHSGCPSPSTSHPWASHQAARAMAALSLLDDLSRRAPSALEPAVLAPAVQPPS